MASTGMIPNYDATLVVPEGTIRTEYQDYLGTEHDIMQAGIFSGREYFSAVGGYKERPFYGEEATRYLLSGDNRMREITLNYGDVSGTVPIHYRECDPNRTFYHHVISIDERPTIDLKSLDDQRYIALEDQLPTEIGSVESPWSPDLAHQPSFDYVQYLVTGDYYYLEEMYFWAGWDLTIGNQTDRQFDVGYIKSETRGMAWALRNIGDAASIAPDADSLEKNYFTQKVNNNLAIYRDDYINSSDWGLIHTIKYMGFKTYEYKFQDYVAWIFPPWQDQFVLITLAHLQAVGFNCQDLVDWLGQTTVDLYHAPDFNWYRSPTMQVPAEYYDDSGDVQIFETWADVDAAFADQPGPDHLPLTSGMDNYAEIARAALTYCLDLPGGQDAFDWLDTHIPNIEGFNEEPGWAIVPFGYVPPADVSPPAAPGNLHQSSVDYTSATVAWTAPGDDGLQGQATSYDLRYSTDLISAGNWNNAHKVDGEPTPGSVGSTDWMVVNGLEDNTTYYFAITATDEAGNTSDLSNVLMITTPLQPDSTPPAAVDHLDAGNATSNSVTLTWDAPGNDGSDGTAAIYDVRYSTNLITNTNWDSATPATGEPTPSVAGTPEYMTVSGLNDDTLYYFGIKTTDDASNTSDLSNIASGMTLVDPATTTVVTIEDFGNAAIASYTSYSGNMVPSGSSCLSGWEIGGRYFEITNIGTDPVMAATQGYAGYDVGIDLASSSSEYQPVWDAAQQSEAVSLADAANLRLAVTMDATADGTPDTTFHITMYYYDTSAAAPVSVEVLADGRTVWTADQTKVYSVQADSIPGFDKSEDLVYGFRMTGVWMRVSGVNGRFALNSIAYTIPNGVPVVGAGNDQTINWPVDSVTLNGTATDDGRPNPPATLTTTWSKASGPGTVTFGDASALTTTATFSEAGIYTLQLQADDGAAQITDTCTITVDATNAAPTVSAGQDQMITLPDGVTLNGSVTDDGLPNPPATVTATWSMVSGPGTVTFADANAASTTATFSVAGTYVLQLHADDSALTADGTCTITVNPANTAPTVNAGAPQTITLPDGATLTGTVNDDSLPNPPAAVTVTWSKVSGPGTVAFADANAASTTATFSVAGTYVLQLHADDSALTADATCTITVNPANTAPTVDAGSDQAITLPAAATLSGTVNDDSLPNPPAAVTVTWSKVSGPGTVTFGNANAVDTTATFSTDGTYVLQLLADDSALTASNTCTVTVNPAGASSEVAIEDLSGCSVASYTSYGGNMIPTGSAYLSGWEIGGRYFEIEDVSGDLMMSGTAGYGGYDIGTNLVASDHEYQPDYDQAEAINLADAQDLVVKMVNRVGTSGTTNLSPTVVMYYYDTSAAVTAHVTVFSIDETWSVDEVKTRTVAISNISGFDKTADLVYGFRVTNTFVYMGGQHGPIGLTYIGYTVANTAPTVNAGNDQTIALPADATLGGSVTDDGLPNPPGSFTVTWSKVTGPGTVTFADANAASTTASFSVDGTYVLRLTASDGDLSASADVTVTVTPVNTAPTVNAGNAVQITLPADASLSGSVTDDNWPNPPGAVTVTWSKVSGPGTVTFADANAASTTASFSVDGTYVLRLTASDGDLSSSDDLTVTVHPAGPVDVAIEDFTGCSTGSYTSYGGNMIPSGSAYLTGWEIGGRYFEIEYVSGDLIMSATAAYGGYDIGTNLVASDHEYQPDYDQAEAISLADADDLKVEMVNRVGSSGTTNLSPTVVMYYYDTSAATTAYVQILSIDETWSVDEVKTRTVAISNISGFDKTADLVYGFRVTNSFVYMGGQHGPIGLTYIGYVRN